MIAGDVIFRVDASHKVGGGHLSRCISLAEQAKKSGLESTFFLYGDEKAKSIINNAGFNTLRGQAKSIAEQVLELEKIQIGQKIVIADFIHTDTLFDRRELDRLLALWKKKAKLLVVIDGGINQSVRDGMATPSVDVLIAPYIGEIIDKKKPYLQLFGPQYFIFNKAYENVKPKIINQTVSKILVTCGLSDPLVISEAIIRVLNKIDRQLEIRVAKGMMFDDLLKEKLENIIEKSSHAITLLNAPDNLKRDMEWCDIAIATSGLTKYELARVGVPTLLISIDQKHETINEMFLREGTSISVGYYNQQKTPKLIYKNLIELQRNVDMRKSMAQAGQLLFDGLGAQRIIRKIIDL